MDAPISYYRNFVDKPDETFHTLWNELDWLRVAPRREYYCHNTGKPYTYGRGPGQRTYEAQPYHPLLLASRDKLQDLTGMPFEVLFLNGYENERDHLGLHNDESDDKRPIAIVTLGAAREITFVRNEDIKDKSKRVTLLLEHGSLCLMHPGMQRTHKHGILKVGRQCGPRLSETFRGDQETAQ